MIWSSLTRLGSFYTSITLLCSLETIAVPQNLFQLMPWVVSLLAAAASKYKYPPYRLRMTKDFLPSLHIIMFMRRVMKDNHPTSLGDLWVDEWYLKYIRQHTTFNNFQGYWNRNNYNNPVLSRWPYIEFKGERMYIYVGNYCEHLFPSLFRSYCWLVQNSLYIFKRISLTLPIQY